MRQAVLAIVAEVLGYLLGLVFGLALLFVAIAAIPVLLTIVGASIALGFLVGSALGAIGAPEAIQGIPLVIGFWGGLVLAFLASLYVWRHAPGFVRRHLPTRVRSALEKAEEDEGEGPASGTVLPVLSFDPAADRTTLDKRIRDADAALSRGSGGAASEPADHPASDSDDRGGSHRAA